MAVVYNIMDYIQIADAVQATGTWDSVAAAVQSGAVYQAGQNAYTAFQVIEGGAAASVTSFDSALEAAKAASLGATAATFKTAAGTILKNATTGVVKAAGLLTLEVPAVAAACAPFAGVVLGAELYEKSPRLWTKISEKLLPFCYAENKIQAYLDYVVDSATGMRQPVVLIATAIIETLKELFEEEGIGEVEHEEVTNPNYTGPIVQPITLYSSGTYTRLAGGTDTVTVDGNLLFLVPNNSDSAFYGFLSTSPGYATVERSYGTTSRYTLGGPYKGYYYATSGPGSNIYTGVSLTRSTTGASPDMMEIIDLLTTPGASVDPIGGYPEGTSAPTAPVEPIVWPDTPIIIVPDPLGPDYQPIPVTPITPVLPPAPETPLLPEHVPDPTPEEPPEEWPDEEPWPTVIPFPVQPTEPDPDWPEVMPWPLPAEPPSEWPTTPWPDEFPYGWPEENPWPRSPDEWPDTVQWPEVAPEDWPEEIPWPESPEDWPEEIPWPTPYPENWPDDQPWPMKWPEEIPYPWKFPYPIPSDDPYPDPRQTEEPEKRIDPFIDPWPYPWPEPQPDPEPKPDPYRDPSQPQPKPEPEPEPEPEPQPKPEPKNPYPTPPSGEPTPPSPPIIPLPFSSTTGIISIYHPTQSELLAFANWLWVTWQDATIDKIWNNPFDGVISLFELYCTPTDVGRKNIRSGFLDSGISSETISRYTELNCGTIAVPEYYGNYFDYSPYSKCHIYLPFIGIIELNVDDIVGHGVNVTYRIDEYNGSCIAMVTVAKSTIVNGEEIDYSTIMYQFSGNCAVDLPFAGGSQAAIKAGMLEAAAWGLGSVISGVITGGTEGGLGIGQSIGNNLAQGAANAVHSLVSAKSSVQHSGSFGASYGAMGGKVPYIIVTRPKQIQVPNYNELYGYQAHKMVRIGDCTGYLRCREVHVISPTASDDEKAQIEQLLKLGVYVTE